MTDYYQRVIDEQGALKKLAAKIPGFSGYVERADRRSSDKILRDTVANHFETLWQQISEIQRSLLAKGEIELMDDFEAAALKMRQFIDRIKNAAYGYAGFFDPIKVKGEELAAIYEYDLSFLKLEDEIKNTIDRVQTSLEGDTLPTIIQELVTLVQNCLDTFDKRKEAILSISSNEIVKDDSAK